MTKVIKDIQRRFNRANIVEKLIAINVLIFLATFIIKAFANLMLWNENVIFDWFSLPASTSLFLTKPWTLISYGFLHADFFHILFNLLVLFYIGNLFLDFFSNRDFLIYYFLGILFGGVLYLLSYNFFPALKSDRSFLVGASAGVTAILIGIAARIPNYALRFRFIGAIKLWYIAAAIVILDIVQIPVGNAGGHIAHLGGAVIGFILTSYTVKGENLGSFFTKYFKAKKQKPLKTVYKKPGSFQSSNDKNAHQRKIDAILDKISKSGYETLTPEEKEFLFSAGKK